MQPVQVWPWPWPCLTFSWVSAGISPKGWGTCLDPNAVLRSPGRSRWCDPKWTHPLPFSCLCSAAATPQACARLVTPLAFAHPVPTSWNGRSALPPLTELLLILQEPDIVLVSPGGLPAPCPFPCGCVRAHVHTLTHRYSEHRHMHLFSIYTHTTCTHELHIHP